MGRGEDGWGEREITVRDIISKSKELALNHWVASIVH